LDKTILYQSYSIFYKIEGEGIPLMLIHGFAEDGGVWDLQADLLAKNCCLIRPDLPGSGKSFTVGEAGTGSGKNLPETMEGYADCLKSILDAENIISCLMIGHSMGGYISLAFAEKYPDRLQALGLFHSTAFADNEEKKNTRRKSIEFIGKHGASEFVRQSTPNLFSEGYKQKNPDGIREFLKRYDNFKAGSLVSYYEAMIKRPERTAVLRNSRVPVLFLIGEKDNAVPLYQSLQQSHLPEIAYIHILESAAHMGMLEETGEVNHLLLSFIKNVVK
jgi:pimeloyl-ACP methyl ester carboxylesterase